MMLERRVLVALSLGIALICAAVAPGAALAADGGSSYLTYHATLTAGIDDTPGAGLKRLQMFYSKLLKALNVKDLGNADVGCEGCDQLSSALPGSLVELQFYMTRKQKTLNAFTRVWAAIQQTTAVPDFALSFDGKTIGHDCPPSPCRPRPICVQTGGCDNPYGGICNKCQ